MLSLSLHVVQERLPLTFVSRTSAAAWEKKERLDAPVPESSERTKPAILFFFSPERHQNADPKESVTVPINVVDTNTQKN